MPIYRKIVEQHLGRKLLTHEIVHHKDGNQNNNNIDNLEVMNRIDHSNWHAKNKDVNNQRLQEFINKTFNGSNLVEALEVFFSKRQLEIIYKKVEGKPLSKTEKEYYSRSIKYKIKALVHPGLKYFCENVAWELS